MPHAGERTARQPGLVGVKFPRVDVKDQGPTVSVDDAAYPRRSADASAAY